MVEHEFWKFSLACTVRIGFGSGSIVLYAFQSEQMSHDETARISGLVLCVSEPCLADVD